MAKNLIEEFVADPENMRLFQQERAIYEVTELLEHAMREARVTRSGLAKKLGKSKGWVTQLLDGEANKTIRTVADAFAVLGHEYRSSYRPIRIGRRTATRFRQSEPATKGSVEGPVILQYSRQASSPSYKNYGSDEPPKPADSAPITRDVVFREVQ